MPISYICEGHIKLFFRPQMSEKTNRHRWLITEIVTVGTGITSFRIPNQISTVVILRLPKRQFPAIYGRKLYENDSIYYRCQLSTVVYSDCNHCPRISTANTIQITRVKKSLYSHPHFQEMLTNGNTKRNI
jgi:hypothetical protein